MQSGRDIRRFPTATLNVHEHVIAGEHVLIDDFLRAKASRYKLNVPYLAHHVSPRPACTQPYGERRILHFAGPVSKKHLSYGFDQQSRLLAEWRSRPRNVGQRDLADC